MKNLLLFTIVFLVASFYANCQDTLRLLNGKVMEVEIGNVTDNVISFRPKFSKKTSFQERTTDEIFSFQKQGQENVQVYKYNPEKGNLYKIEEMKEYILGEQHADKYHRSIATKVSALAVGAAAGYLVADGGVMLAATPVIFSTIMMVPPAHVQKNKLNSELKKKAPYRHGYRRVAKGKRFLNNLGYTALGMIGSFVIFEFTDAGNN